MSNTELSGAWRPGWASTTRGSPSPTSRWPRQPSTGTPPRPPASRSSACSARAGHGSTCRPRRRWPPYAKGGFPTPSGKVELRSSLIEAAGGPFVLPLFREGYTGDVTPRPLDPVPGWVPSSAGGPWSLSLTTVPAGAHRAGQRSGAVRHPGRTRGVPGGRGRVAPGDDDRTRPDAAHSRPGPHAGARPRSRPPGARSGPDRARPRAARPEPGPDTPARLRRVLWVQLVGSAILTRQCAAMVAAVRVSRPWKV